jgi:hypothetical protein
MELAKRYIVWRSIVKAIKKDLITINKGELVFSSIYRSYIEEVLAEIERDMKKLRCTFIRVEKTDQPTVWEVSVGKRHGYIEVNVVEIMTEFEVFFTVKGKGR